MSSSVFAFKHITEKYSNYNVEAVRVVRTPIGGDGFFARKVLGHFARNKSPHHDAVFHLYTEMKVRDPETGKQASLLFEKNELLNAFESQGGVKQGSSLISSFEVNVPEQLKGRLKVGEMIARTKDLYASQNLSFERYDLATNNCQILTMNILKANGLWQYKYDNFINQHASEIIPFFLKPIAKGATDYYADYRLRREGVKDITDISPDFSGSPTPINLRHYYYNGPTPKDLDFSANAHFALRPEHGTPSGDTFHPLHHSHNSRSHTEGKYLI